MVASNCKRAAQLPGCLRSRFYGLLLCMYLLIHVFIYLHIYSLLYLLIRSSLHFLIWHYWHTTRHPAEQSRASKVHMAKSGKIITKAALWQFVLEKSPARLEALTWEHPLAASIFAHFDTIDMLRVTPF